MFKLDLEKAEIKLPTSVGSSKKQEKSRKTSTSALLTMPKPLTPKSQQTVENSSNRWEYQTTWPASWEICTQVKKQLDMEQQTGSQSGEKYVKAVYCHPAYLTYMQGEKKRKVKLLSHVRLFATPWTVAHQAPLSMGFSRQ